MDVENILWYSFYAVESCYGEDFDKAISKASSEISEHVTKIEVENAELQKKNKMLIETIEHYMDCVCMVISYPPCAKCVALEKGKVSNE